MNASSFKWRVQSHCGVCVAPPSDHLIDNLLLEPRRSLTRASGIYVVDLVWLSCILMKSRGMSEGVWFRESAMWTASLCAKPSLSLWTEEEAEDLQRFIQKIHATLQYCKTKNHRLHVQRSAIQLALEMHNRVGVREASTEGSVIVGFLWTCIPSRKNCVVDELQLRSCFSWKRSANDRLEEV
jgi:hypothetical protein